MADDEMPDLSLELSQEQILGPLTKKLERDINDLLELARASEGPDRVLVAAAVSRLEGILSDLRAGRLG